jgi:hypothetical protein
MISSVLRSKAPLVGSFVHGDSVISSITKPYPKFVSFSILILILIIGYYFSFNLLIIIVVVY